MPFNTKTNHVESCHLSSPVDETFHGQGCISEDMFGECRAENIELDASVAEHVPADPLVYPTA